MICVKKGVPSGALSCPAIRAAEAKVESFSSRTYRFTPYFGLIQLLILVTAYIRIGSINLK